MISLDTHSLTNFRVHSEHPEAKLELVPRPSPSTRAVVDLEDSVDSVAVPLEPMPRLRLSTRVVSERPDQEHQLERLLRPLMFKANRL